MGSTSLRFFSAMSVAVCFSILSARAADNTPTPMVHVVYASGDTETAIMKSNVKLMSNVRTQIGDVPDELDGLTFARRAGGKAADVTISVDAGATVYVLIDSDKSGNARFKGVKELNKSLAESGWTRLADAVNKDGKHAKPAIYKQVFTAAKTFTVPGVGYEGAIVAAKSLTVGVAGSASDTTAAGKPESPSKTETSPVAAPSREVAPSPAVAPAPVVVPAPPVEHPAAKTASHVVMPQTSIKGCEVYESDTGLILGKTSELVLTVTPGGSAHAPAFGFGTPVDDQTNLAKDDVIRFIRVTYPSWYADEAVVTFEDKEVTHGGGSFGAAFGTMMLSVLQGVAIDPNAAITGAVGANGNVHAVGGVSAKLNGAIASKCNLIAVPNENLDQLVDAVIYSGPAIVSDIQIIGIANLADAVATTRVDRDSRLDQAIAIFAELQQDLKKSPDYLRKKEAVEKLNQVLRLAPQHLSAKVLLMSAEGKLPKTLSATASQFYTYLAGQNMLEVLKQRDAAHDKHLISSGVIRAGLADLRKLRPMSDTRVRPLIDAWLAYIGAWNQLQQGEGGAQDVEKARQALLDEMASEKSDPQLMQKMLKEGM